MQIFNTLKVISGFQEDSSALYSLRFHAVQSRGSGGTLILQSQRYE